MLSDEEFEDWCSRLNLKEAARSVVFSIRSSDPSRRVGGGRRNVSGRYPSRKMGQTIQFESHHVELPMIYELEHDENVLEFYDQPPQIRIEYQSKSGRQLGVLYTPDFFVLRTDEAGWVECKTEADLSCLTLKSPFRYVQVQKGKWRCPPGESYAERFGFDFSLRSDAEIDWVLQRNFIFLEDYFRGKSLTVNAAATAAILSLVTSRPGIVLAELLHHAEGVSVDNINTLIATEQLYVNLRAAPLAEPERVRVFRDVETACAYALMTGVPTNTAANKLLSIHKVAGASISWDGKGLTILHVGDKNIVLRGEDEQLIELKHEDFENLVRLEKITGISPQMADGLSAETQERLLQASPDDLEEANRRYRAIEPYLRGQPPENDIVSERTIRDWKAKYRVAEQRYGCGYIGLLSHSCAKGNRNRKLPSDTLALMDKFITEDYCTLKQKKMWEVYCALVRVCEHRGVIVPSYKTFTRTVKQRSGYEQTLKRKGRRAAYQQEPFYWELDRTTPRHGDRPFEIGHIDHTELDTELICSRTGRHLGRPWATFLIDAYSRRLLAVYLTFDEPSYRSCMMLLRICVQRHERLPQNIVVDNGPEFGSIYFETLLARYECTKKQRPAAASRFGSVCERLFGTSNTQLIHNLAGNTQIMRHIRQVTKSVNPKNHALWSLGLLYEYLCFWAYQVYDTEEHPALLQSPREAWTTGQVQSGNRAHRLIADTFEFRLLTLPTTTKGKAKVQPGLGVKINYLYYWSNAFRNPEIEKTWVDVRYDPFDAGIAYAFISGQWVQCICQNYADFRGRSEKELRLASIELHKRQQNHTRQSTASALKLATFLTSVEAQEALLVQRLRDAEARDVFELIEQGLSNQSPISQASAEHTVIDSGNDIKEPSPESTSNAPLELEQLELYEEY